MRYKPAPEDEAHRAENPEWPSKNRNTGGLTGPVSQSFVGKDPRCPWALLRHTLSSSSRK
ncbi:hypothetical protein ElyMa_005642500, partial [Elysia marginata]